MKRFFRNFRFAMLGVSILCIALGLAVLLWPENAMKMLCYGFGGVLILSGLLQVVSYVVGERNTLLQKMMLVSGVVAAVAGVWVILMRPDGVQKLTLIVMGVLLLYHGAMDVKYGFDVKSAQGRTWGAVLFFGIATCAIGVLLLVNPFAEPQTLFMTAGLGFLFDGATDLFTVFSVAGAKARYERLSGSEPVIELEPGQTVHELPVEGGGAAAEHAAAGGTDDAPAEEAGEFGETGAETGMPAEIGDADGDGDGDGGDD